MQKIVIVLLCAGICWAKPLEELKSDIEGNVRAFYDNAQTAVKDLSEKAVESGEKLLEESRSYLQPTSAEDKAAGNSHSLRELVRSLSKSAQSELRSLVARALEDGKPLKQNVRDLARNLVSASQAIEDKYLTQDGQEMVRAFANSMLPNEEKTLLSV